MERSVTIDWDAVKGAVRKHLSLIGKRLQDKMGDIMFSKVTLSTAEEEILKQYVNSAAEIFVSQMSDLVKYYDSGDFLEFRITNSRLTEGDGIVIAFEGNFMGYAVAYCANAVLGANYPDLAKKYTDDMTNHVRAALSLIYTKRAPSVSTAKYEEVKGSAELSEDETKIGF